jgi:hypothetical protein
MIYWTFQEREGERAVLHNPLVWVLSYQRIALKDFAAGQCPHIPGHALVPEHP